jgi:RNA polymerase sigma-70 factor (ECF subfamily)
MGHGEMERVDAHDAVVRALGRLSDDERRALALRYGADLPMRNIAALMGQSRKSVEGRIYRALEKLRLELGSDELLG